MEKILYKKLLCTAVTADHEAMNRKFLLYFTCKKKIL